MAVKKRLYRSKDDVMVAGVCAGIAEFFETDPTIVRILWIVFTLLSMGTGILLYIAMALVVPEKPNGKTAAKATPRQREDAARFFGAFLIFLGLIIISEQLGFGMMAHSITLLPLLLVFLGLALVYGSYSSRTHQ